jgi:hypothetical protein
MPLAESGAHEHRRAVVSEANQMDVVDDPFAYELA